MTSFEEKLNHYFCSLYDMQIFNCKAKMNDDEFAYLNNDSNGLFIEYFNMKTGQFVQSGLLVEDKRGTYKVNEKVFLDTEIEPDRRYMPSLLDIAIAGSCTTCGSCGVGCYLKAKSNPSPDMSIETFEKIIKEVSPHVFQVALAGYGNINYCKDFEEYLKICRKYNVVPNFTTAMITKEQAEIAAKYCGSVAVSWHPTDGDYSKPQKYTLDSLNNLYEAGIKPSIQYVVSKSSVPALIDYFRFGKFDEEKINTITLLKYKTTGDADPDEVIDIDSKDFLTLCVIINNWSPFAHHGMRLSADSCTMAQIQDKCDGIDKRSILLCEAGRYSAWITMKPELRVFPCSIANEKEEYAERYREGASDFKRIWDGGIFQSFRCDNSKACSGRCAAY